MTGNESGPLAGLRVLELGSFIAGPFAGQLLGDLGADVVQLPILEHHLAGGPQVVGEGHAAGPGQQGPYTRETLTWIAAASGGI